MGKKSRRGIDGTWLYPPLATAMVEAGLQEVETYFSRCKKIFSYYIATRPIMDLSLSVERCLGTRVSRLWWYQEGLDLEGMRTVARML